MSSDVLSTDKLSGVPESSTRPNTSPTYFPDGGRNSQRYEESSCHQSDEKEWPYLPACLPPGSGLPERKVSTTVSARPSRSFFGRTRMGGHTNE
jgi:hypothetical protein